MPETTDSLQHLIPGLRAGRQDAYRELTQIMGEPLSRYALRIVGDSGTAQDVVQDALVRIFKYRKRLNEQFELRGLCFRTVRNLARNHVRNATLRRTREQEADDMRGGDGKNELAHQAWELVSTLPSVLRDVIELRFSYGLSRKEIASALELPEGTVATRQRTALESLRDEMQKLSVAPAVVGLPAIAELLGKHQPTSPTPNLIDLEELVMNGIRKLRVRTAGMVASAVLVALMLSVAGVASVSALTNRTATGPADTAATIAADKPDKRDTGRLPAATNNDSSKFDRAEPAGSPANGSSTDQVSNEVAPREDTGPVDGGSSITEPMPETLETPVKPEPEVFERAPEFVSEPAFSATVGEEYRYSVQVAGAPAPRLESRKLPAWLTLEGSSLHGTPLEADAGKRVQVILVGINGVSPDAVHQFEINVKSAPSFITSPEKNAVSTEKYSYEIGVKGEPKPTLTLKNAPAWLSLTGETLSGSPAASDAGEWKDVKVVASNGVNPDAEQVWTIVVNCPPSFETQPVEAVKAGEEYVYEIKTSGWPAPTLDASKLPDWLKLKENRLFGTPRNEDIGMTKKIKLTADNGVNPADEQSFKIEVVENPEYVEIPWTADDIKGFVYVGMKWHMKGSYTENSHGMPYSREAEDRLYEITEVTDSGFSMTYTYEGISVMNKKVTRLPETLKLTMTWSEAMDIALYGIPVGLDLDRYDYTTTDETIRVAGKSRKCKVLTFIEKDDKNEEITRRTIKAYYCSDLPFAAVRLQTTTVWKGMDSTEVTTQDLHEFKSR